MSAPKNVTLLEAFKQLQGEGITWVAFRGLHSPQPRVITPFDEHYGIYHVGTFIERDGADPVVRNPRAEFTVQRHDGPRGFEPWVYSDGQPIWVAWHEPEWPWAIDQYGQCILAMNGADEETRIRWLALYIEAFTDSAPVRRVEAIARKHAEEREAWERQKAKAEAKTSKSAKVLVLRPPKKPEA